MKNKDFKDLLTSIRQVRKIHSGKMRLTKEPKKKDPKRELISWLKQRIRLLENTRQHYKHNQNLAKNVKIANIELVQNEIESLEELLTMVAKNISNITQFLSSAVFKSQDFLYT